MRVLIVNTSERTGGAALAANRLMDALNNNGVKAKMLVRDKLADNITVVPLSHTLRNHLRFLWERWCIFWHLHFKRKHLFEIDIANTGADITRLSEFKEADIIHLSWINQGMLSLKGIRKILNSGKPVVWTMHDIWPATGICHITLNCQRFQSSCGNCRLLPNGGSLRDLSYKVFKRKKAMLEGHDISFVTCSKWLEKEVRKSALLTNQQIQTIPNPIDIRLFRPGDRKEARTRCRLPQAMKLMLFGSVKITDKRKGIDYLVESCRLLAERHPELKEELGVVVFGNRSQQVEHLLPFKVYPLDYVADEHRLADIYNAVDIFVTPSLEENLPNTIMEAMACGTPCVGFRVGGIPEMIDHLQNGYVAQYKSAEDFADGIYRTLTSPDYPLLAEQAARKAVTHYSENIVAKQYIDLYMKISGRNV